MKQYIIFRNEAPIASIMTDAPRKTFEAVAKTIGEACQNTKDMAATIVATLRNCNYRALTDDELTRYGLAG